MYLKAIIMYKSIQGKLRYVDVGTKVNLRLQYLTDGEEDAIYTAGMRATVVSPHSFAAATAKL